MPRVAKVQTNKTPVELAADTLRTQMRGTVPCPTCGHKMKAVERDAAFDKALRSFIASPRVSVQEELVSMDKSAEHALSAYRKVYVAEYFDNADG